MKKLANLNISEQYFSAMLCVVNSKDVLLNYLLLGLNEEK